MSSRKIAWTRRTSRFTCRGHEHDGTPHGQPRVSWLIVTEQTCITPQTCSSVGPLPLPTRILSDERTCCTRLLPPSLSNRAQEELVSSMRPNGSVSPRFGPARKKNSAVGPHSRMHERLSPRSYSLSWAVVRWLEYNYLRMNSPTRGIKSYGLLGTCVASRQKTKTKTVPIDRWVTWVALSSLAIPVCRLLNT